MIDKEWYLDGERANTEESRPYSKCPKCGEFKFTTFRIRIPWWIRDKGYDYWKECKNCRYMERIK